MNLYEVAREIGTRLTATFLRDGDGRRPAHGGQAKFQTDPHWRDLLLFYEYFNGDNGAGVGARHQTGWTGLAALSAVLFHLIGAEDLLARGPAAARGAARGRGGPMTTLPAPRPAQPVICEVNTVVWRGEPSRRSARRVTLGGVPAEPWDEPTLPGAGLVWLMGAWEGSP